jgi:hypothetical protein
MKCNRRQFWESIEPSSFTSIGSVMNIKLLLRAVTGRTGLLFHVSNTQALDGLYTVKIVVFLDVTRAILRRESGASEAYVSSIFKVEIFKFRNRIL